MPQDIRKEQERATCSVMIHIMAATAVGRGDRVRNGALCPSVNLVPGGCDDIIGGALSVSPFEKMPFCQTPSRARGPCSLVPLAGSGTRPPPGWGKFLPLRDKSLKFLFENDLVPCLWMTQLQKSSGKIVFSLHCYFLPRNVP